MRKKGGRNYFDRLAPVLCTVASHRDPRGIVRLQVAARGRKPGRIRGRIAPPPGATYCPDWRGFRSESEAYEATFVVNPQSEGPLLLRGSGPFDQPAAG
jgi:hypothetical protein